MRSTVSPLASPWRSPAAISGTQGADLAAKVRSFATALNRTQTASALTYQLPDVAVRRVNGRPRRYNFPVKVFTFDVGLVPAVAELHCMDLNIYDDATSTVSWSGMGQ